MALNANELHIPTPSQKRASHIRLSAMHYTSTAINSRYKQRNESERTGVQLYIWKVKALKVDETAQCYRARAVLTCHRRGSMY